MKAVPGGAASRRGPAAEPSGWPLIARHAVRAGARATPTSNLRTTAAGGIRRTYVFRPR